MASGLDKNFVVQGQHDCCVRNHLFSPSTACCRGSFALSPPTCHDSTHCAATTCRGLQYAIKLSTLYLMPCLVPRMQPRPCSSLRRGLRLYCVASSTSSGSCRLRPHCLRGPPHCPRPHPRPHSCSCRLALTLIAFPLLSLLDPELACKETRELRPRPEPAGAFRDGSGSNFDKPEPAKDAAFRPSRACKTPLCTIHTAVCICAIGFSCPGWEGVVCFKA
jgi:hypothetical protein